MKISSKYLKTRIKKSMPSKVGQGTVGVRSLLLWEKAIVLDQEKIKSRCVKLSHKYVCPAMNNARRM